MVKKIRNGLKILNTKSRENTVLDLKMYHVAPHSTGKEQTDRPVGTEELIEVTMHLPSADKA